MIVLVCIKRNPSEPLNIVHNLLVFGPIFRGILTGWHEGSRSRGQIHFRSNSAQFGSEYRNEILPMSFDPNQFWQLFPFGLEATVFLSIFGGNHVKEIVGNWKSRPNILDVKFRSHTVEVTWQSRDRPRLSSLRNWNFCKDKRWRKVSANEREFIRNLWSF